MNGNDGTYTDSNENAVKSSNAMFLLSEYALKKMAYDADEAINNESQGYTSDWQYSDVWNWCNNTTDNTSFISSSFTKLEKAYILKTSKANTCSPYSDELKGDMFFPLSSAETESDYIKDNRLALLNGENVLWWLRFPVSSVGIGCVNVKGDIINALDAYSFIAIRPAFNLNLSSVLFTSAANGGKTVNVGTLTKNGVNNGKEYKLTMKDDSRNFAVTEKTVSGAKGKTVELNYLNAQMGSNEYISAMIANSSGNVLYYDQLASATSKSGKVNFTIPSDISFGTYELRLFNEQINDNDKADFSSGFATIELAVGLDGDGTSENPYLIHNTEDLEYFRDMVNIGKTDICGKLVNDIIVNSGTFDEKGNYTPADGEELRKWKPIGIVNTTKVLDKDTNTITEKEVIIDYTGTFDGNGKTISGLYFNDSDFNYVGMFGIVGSGATIKNLGIKNSYFRGNNYVGGIVGRISDSGQIFNSGVTVESCFNEGFINGCHNVGGIVGCVFVSKGSAVKVERCYNAGNVCGYELLETDTEPEGPDNIGGIVGYANVRAALKNIEAPVFNPSTGSFETRTEFYSDETTFTMSNCYNTACVKAKSDEISEEDIVVELIPINANNFGGIVGKAEMVYVPDDKMLYGIPTKGVRELSVSHCYNIGDICECKNAGEIAGYAIYYNEAAIAIERDTPLTTITECYYLKDSETECDSETIIYKSTDAFVSGEVAYLLQGDQTDSVWGQNIGTDKYPTFDSAKVYEDEYDGIKAYRNEIDGNKILLLGADKKSATVLLKEEGTYTVIFAGYNGKQMANIKSFEVTVSEEQAVRVVSNESFKLGTGDKVMLWRNFVNLTPLCEMYEIK